MRPLPRPAAEAGVERQPKVLAVLREALFADPALWTYAVIDSAARPDLLDGVPQTCLIVGRLDPEVAVVAPWLVPLTPDSPVLAALAAGWGRNKAIFVLSRYNLGPLRRHLRTVTLARVPDGRTVYFRFCDPRVLRDVMPVLTETQRQRLFGTAVEGFLFEGAAGDRNMMRVSRVLS